MGEHKIGKPNREEYIDISTSAVKFNRRTETVSFKDSVGRVTSKDVFSVNMLPNKPTSARDGIAIRFEDIIAKNVDTKTWEEGKEYIFSNTGVAIPPEYDTAIVIEEVEFDENNRLHIKKLPKSKGEGVVPCGKIMEEGELIVPANYLITPLQLGVLASGGIYEIEVIAKPKVAIIPTGNELVQAGSVLPPGKNIETNGIVMEALVKEWGGEPILYPIISDDSDHIYNALCHALKRSDIVVFNAGSSKGTSDYSKEFLPKIGKVYNYNVDHGPARHTSFTIANNKKPVIGIVGPPKGAELTVPWYIRPLINKYLRLPKAEPQKLKARLSISIDKNIAFDYYYQVIVSKENTEYIVEPLHKDATRAEMSIKANGILCVPGGKTLKEGDKVTVELKVPIEYIL